jgi:protein gp37
VLIFSSYYLPSFASKIAFTRTNVETTKNNLTSVPVVDIMARMPNARKIPAAINFLSKITPF